MTNDDLEKLRPGLARKIETSHAIAADFVKNQLSLGFTFAEDSREHRANGEQEQADKDLATAKDALSQARRFLSVASFTDQQRHAIEDSMQELEQVLASLEGSKPSP